jgi:hypothetical protein
MCRLCCRKHKIHKNGVGSITWAYPYFKIVSRTLVVKNMKGKILINVPNLELAGGVAEIYRILNLDFLGKSKYFYIYFDSN